MIFDSSDPSLLNGENINIVTELANFGNGSAIPGGAGDRAACLDATRLEIRDGL